MAYLIDRPVRTGYSRLNPPFPWVTERPSTAKPDETFRTWGEVPVDVSPAGRYELTAPEGTADWTPARPEDTAAWTARKMAEKSAQEESANMRAMAQARAESLAADEAARARRFQEYDVQRLLSDIQKGAASKDPTKAMQLSLVAPMLTQMMGLTGEPGKPGQTPGGLEASFNIPIPGGGSVRLAHPSANLPKGWENFVPAKIFTQVLSETGDVNRAMEAANQARLGVIGQGSFTREQQGTLGGYTGPGRRARVQTAEQIEEAKGNVPFKPAPTVPGAPEGMTRAGLKNYLQQAGDEQAKSLIKAMEAQKLLQRIDEIDALSSKINVEEPGMGAWTQGAVKWLGGVTKTDLVAQNYMDTKESVMGEFARQISQERGVLTNQDLDRVRRAFPALTDPKQSRDYKIGRLRLIAQTNADAYRAFSRGESFEDVQARYRPKLDQLVGELEMSPTVGGRNLRNFNSKTGKLE